MQSDQRKSAKQSGIVPGAWLDYGEAIRVGPTEVVSGAVDRVAYRGRTITTAVLAIRYDKIGVRIWR